MKKLLLFLMVLSGQSRASNRFIFEVPAKNKEERTFISNLGLAIDEVRSDRVFINGNSFDRTLLKNSGLKFIETIYQDKWDQVPRAAKYRSYQDVVNVFKELSVKHPELATVESMGKSLEGRDQPVLRISGLSPGEAESAHTPAILYQGCHHAREYLSVEVPLRFAEYLINGYATNEDIKKLLDTREVFIAPVINPDGFSYDYTSGTSGKNWRKNRKPFESGVYGVDLNRNYGFGWGGGGASPSASSDTYRGPSAFSEIEVQNVREFVKAKRHRMNIVMDFHSYSELILYPWGYTSDEISNSQDMKVHTSMAKQMATWNGYTPEAASDLYIASGVSIDYFYGELGMTTFTFELSPASFLGGGFYPNPSKIESVFAENLKPMLYLLEYADDPSRVLREAVPEFLEHLGEKQIKIARYSDLTAN